MTSAIAGSRAQPVPAVRRFSLRRIEVFWGLLFISPWIVGFLVFVAFPMLASLYLSCTDYKIGVDNTNWIGLQNYSRLLSLEVRQLDRADQPASDVLSRGYQELFRIGQTVVGATDTDFWRSMKVTLLFAVISLPVSQVLALALALLTNMRLPFVKLYRTIFYLPFVVPAIAGAIIFQQVLNRDVGWLNALLKVLGIPGPDWLTDERLVLPALALIGLWGIGNAMIIYLAGLQGVPTELYEAAEVDGANAAGRFFHITLPMITPVILYNLVIGLINTFQYFTVAYALTIGTSLGAPNKATYFYNLYLYQATFAYSNVSYGSAMAWILLMIVVAITAIVFVTSGRWVFYAGAVRRS
jgi:multiple sugar transport system permease protein